MVCHTEFDGWPSYQASIKPKPTVTYSSSSINACAHAHAIATTAAVAAAAEFPNAAILAVVSAAFLGVEVITVQDALIDGQHSSTPCLSARTICCRSLLADTVEASVRQAVLGCGGQAVVSLRDDVIRRREGVQTQLEHERTVNVLHCVPMFDTITGGELAANHIASQSGDSGSINHG